MIILLHFEVKTVTTTPRSLCATHKRSFFFQGIFEQLIAASVQIFSFLKFLFFSLKSLGKPNYENLCDTACRGWRHHLPINTRGIDFCLIFKLGFPPIQYSNANSTAQQSQSYHQPAEEIQRICAICLG